MRILFVLGTLVGLIAPFLRRSGRAAALAAGAAILSVSTLGYLAHQDARNGLAATAANRRFGLIILACELPVVALAVTSLKGYGKAFWVGWSVHAALAAWLVAVVIWLEFFWHW